MANNTPILLDDATFDQLTEALKNRCRNFILGALFQKGEYQNELVHYLVVGNGNLTKHKWITELIKSNLEDEIAYEKQLPEGQLTEDYSSIGYHPGVGYSNFDPKINGYLVDNVDVGSKGRIFKNYENFESQAFSRWKSALRVANKYVFKNIPELNYIKIFEVLGMSYLPVSQLNYSQWMGSEAFLALLKINGRSVLEFQEIFDAKFNSLEYFVPLVHVRKFGEILFKTGNKLNFDIEKGCSWSTFEEFIDLGYTEW